jgi:hypothetical protein
VSKADAVRQVVARAILSTPAGDQLPTTSRLATIAESGYGSVQTALRSLEDEGAVETTAHGAHGRRIASLDIVKLWRIGRGVLAGVMPLPESREFAGIATALDTLAEAVGIPLQLMFRQGSAGRIRLLQSERVDFMIASTASLARAEGVSHIELGEHTFYGKDSVVVITAVGGAPTRTGLVPIDRNSPDHAALTTSEFPDATFVDTPYLLIPELVADGRLDAAIWHQTTSSPLLTASGLAIHETTRVKPDSEFGRAAIIWREDDRAVARLIDEVFPVGELELVQRAVIKGELVPQF